MGLYASFSVEDFDYPLSISQEVEGEMIEVEIDYAEACEAFCETFIDIATQLVPVDTGYLESTIDADTDGLSCECWAEAEYAQYVEYGTWKMDAQPYFTPALQAGLQAFHELASQELSDAYDTLEDLCSGVVEASVDSMGMFGGLLFSGLLYLFFFPILVNLYGIIDSLTAPFNGGSNSRSRAYQVEDVDVIIT